MTENQPKISFKDFDQICRLCCCQTDPFTDFSSIFDFNYLKIVEYVAQIKIVQSDDLPKKICGDCRDKIELIESFINICCLSNNKLREIEKNYIAENLEDIVKVEDVDDDEIIKIEESSDSNWSDDEKDTNKLHEADLKRACPSCGQLVANMTQHYKKSSACVPRNFKCHLCTYRTDSKPKLNDHTRVHSEVSFEKHHCHLCPKQFKYLKGLRRHLSLHENPNQFVCEFCGKGFTNSYNYIYHKNKHTDTRPHECSECGATFYATVELTQHKKRSCIIKQMIKAKDDKLNGKKAVKKLKEENEQGKVLSCPHCFRTFKKAGHLKKHLQVHVNFKHFEGSKDNV